LYAVQFASYLAPFVTLPWLTRVLGPAGFGRIGFAGAVIGYFVLLADYGFNFSATRQVAMRWDDRAGRSKVFWTTLAVKGGLAAAGLPCLVLLTYCGQKFADQRSLLMISYLTVVGTVLTPIWYFQGIERQTALCIISIVTRFAAIPAIFLCVRSPADVTTAAWITSATSVAGGLLCLVFLARYGELDRPAFKLRDLVRVLQDGWHLFMSTASISLYQATNTVVLGLVAGPAAVGHYSAAEKIIQAAQGMLAPINQSVYPRVSRLMKDSRSEAYSLIRRVLRIQGSIALGLSLVLFLIAPAVIRIFYGPAYEQTIAVLRWLAILPFLVGLSNVLGIHTMMAMGMNRMVSLILVSAGALNLAILYFLAHRFGAVGAAMAVVTTETFVTVAMALILKRRKVPVFSAPTVAAVAP
jgi:PST family polysaccharide transporter